MKTWAGYGSEHSAKLVMIGHFADRTKVRVTQEKFKRLVELVRAEEEAGTMDLGWDADQRFSDTMRAVLAELNLYEFTPSDIENFAYEHDISATGTTITLSTDELEVQGFVKLFLDGEARIEVFSRHDWTEDGQARSS